MKLTFYSVNKTRILSSQKVILGTSCLAANGANNYHVSARGNCIGSRASCNLRLLATCEGFTERNGGNSG